MGVPSLFFIYHFIFKIPNSQLVLTIVFVIARERIYFLMGSFFRNRCLYVVFYTIYYPRISVFFRVGNCIVKKLVNGNFLWPNTENS